MLWCTLIQKGTGTGFAFYPTNENIRHRLQHFNSSYSQNDTSDTPAITALKVPGSTLSATKNCLCTGHCPVPQCAPLSAAISDRALCFSWNLLKSRSWGCFCPGEGTSFLQSSLSEPAGLMGQGTAQKPGGDMESRGGSCCTVPSHVPRPFQGCILRKLCHLARKEFKINQSGEDANIYSVSGAFSREGAFDSWGLSGLLLYFME